MNRGQALRVTLSVAVSAVALWLAVRNVDLVAARDALLGADLPPLLAAVAVVWVSHWVKARRWRLLLPPLTERPRIWSLIAAIVIGQAVNNVSPLRLGELARAYALERRAKVPVLVSLGTLVTEKSLELAALLVLGPLALALTPPVPELRPVGIAGGGLAILALTALVGLAPRAWLLGTLEWLAARLPLLDRARVPQRAAQVVDGVRGGLRPRRVPLLAAWTLAGWVLGALTNWLVLEAVGVDIPPVASLFLLVVLSLGMFVPAAPARIGVQEYLTITALGLFGVPAGQALAVSLLLRLVVFVPTTAVGGWLALRTAQSVPLPRPVGLGQRATPGS